MKKIALIGGTGTEQVLPHGRGGGKVVTTPFGAPSSAILEWGTPSSRFFFIARHGHDGEILPHRVNYRANVWAIRDLQPDHVIGLNSVGGIAAEAWPMRLIFPDQLVDYTWGRAHTFTDASDAAVRHVEFTRPVSHGLREKLIGHADALELDYMSTGTYAVTQGPRLETAAEIDRLERDGCHIVGMTAMPEAALARELALDYVICAVVVNWAAGRGPSGSGIHDDMQRYLTGGMNQVDRLLNVL